MGIGIGLIIATVLLLPFHERKISATEIESKARDLGMIYIDEIKALPDKDKGGDK